MKFKPSRFGLSTATILAASVLTFSSFAATDSVKLNVKTTVEMGTCTASLVDDNDQTILSLLLAMFIFLKSMQKQKLKPLNYSLKTARVYLAKKLRLN